MFALINLFIHILRDLQSSRLSPDLALMDLGAGFFARLQFATDSEISIPFAKDMAALAHSAVENFQNNSINARNESCLNSSSTPQPLVEKADNLATHNHLDDFWQSMNVNNRVSSSFACGFLHALQIESNVRFCRAA